MQLIDALIASRDETVPLFALDEEPLARTYGPGKWSVRYVLHHIADVETVLFERIRRVVSEGRCVTWAFDQKAWAT
jgi:DinB superfamily